MSQLNPNPTHNLANHIAQRAFALMQRRNLIIANPERPVFYAWLLPDRVVLVVDPEMVKNQAVLVDEKKGFQHDLSTILGGRRVITTNSRGIFIQVAYTPPPAKNALRSLPLDLSQQPGPLHVPLGMRREGAFWQPLTALGVIILGGVRGMGKTRVMHGMIQALINGGACDLYLVDGKRGVEFRRYQGQDGVHFYTMSGARQALMDVMSEISRRNPVLDRSGYTSVEEYNDANPSQTIRPILVAIDEISLLPEDCRGMVDELVGTARYAGVYLALATTYPTAEYINPSWKANATCISLPVPTYKESMVVLGRKGAEDLPNIRGRMLMEWQARMIELQAFEVTLPSPPIAYLGPRLDARELKIAAQACEGGLLSIRLLKELHGFTDWKAAKFLEDWEGRGWIEKDPDNKNARRVTQVLRRVVAESSETPQAHKTPETA